MLRLSHILLAALIAAPLSAAAQDADPSKLKALEKQIEQTAAERKRLEDAALSSARAIETIRAEMIAAAKDIQDQERSLTVLEARVAELEREGTRMSKTLGRREAQMVDVLLALERLALRPTDALTLSPLAPSDAVRSAILLRSAIPHIKKSSEALQGELAALYRVRAETVARKDEAAAGAAALVQKHARLDALALEREQRHGAILARGEDVARRMERMAREAEDLRALFAKLAEEKARREEAEAIARAAAEKEKRETAEKLAAEKAAAEAKVKAAAQQAAPSPAKPEERQLAGLPPAVPSGGEEPVTRSFAKARGTMPFPVTGALAQRYGAATQAAGEAGLLAKGITIAARPGAQVVAPFDGLVAFAGPFRGYGQLLIIEHSEGYHTLLAGLGHIDATVGQRVLAGEPVGVMENQGAPTLYVELRRDGQPINPLPWLADRAGKNSG